jgi:hypothetical protein
MFKKLAYVRHRCSAIHPAQYGLRLHVVGFRLNLTQLCVSRSGCLEPAPVSISTS